MHAAAFTSSADRKRSMARFVSLFALLLAPLCVSPAAAQDTPWNRYASSGAGFSLHYPPFWEPVADPPQGVAFQAADPRSVGNGNCSVSVTRMEAVGLVTPEVVLAQMNGRMLLSAFRSALPDARLVDSGRARLGGAEGFSAVVEGTRAGAAAPERYRMMFVLAYRGRQKYTLMCAAVADAYPEAEPLFQKVRDSFRFGGPALAAPGADASGVDVAAYVDGVGRRIATVAGLTDVSFTVTQQAMPDIRVLMGPRVAISRGLLDALHSEAELAAVLAHQVAHLVRGDRGGPYGPEAERDADRLALEYLAQNDYDVAAAIDVMERFQGLEGQPGWTTGILAEHPLSEERLAALRKAAGKVGPGGIQGQEFYRRNVLAAAGPPAL